MSKNSNIKGTSTNKNAKTVSYGKNGKSGKNGNVVAKKNDRAAWIVAGVIAVVAIVGIILLASFASSPKKVNGSQNTPSQQTTTVPECCQ